MYQQIGGDVNAADDGGLFVDRERVEILQVRNLYVETHAWLKGFSLEWREWEPDVWRKDEGLLTYADLSEHAPAELLAEAAMDYYGGDDYHVVETWAQVMECVPLHKTSFLHYQDEWDTHDWSDGEVSY